MSTNSKRRKISLDGTPSEAPSAVLAPSASATAAGTAHVSLELDEIPQLLLVDLQKEDENSVLEALQRLYDLAEDDGSNDEGTPNTKVAIQIGAASHIILTMNKWKRNEEIQECSCHCLAKLSFCREGACVLALSGGVDVIATALKIFSGSVDIHRSGINTLMNVSCGLNIKSQPIQKVTRRFLEELDGMALVRKAMEKFPDDAELQANCCGLLENLAYNKAFRPYLIKGNAITLAGAAMARHFEDEEVQTNGKDFLKQLTGK